MSSMYGYAAIAIAVAALIWWFATSRDFLAGQSKVKKDQADKRARFSKLSGAAETGPGERPRTRTPDFGRR